ncbi:dTDP-4-dehydrorhamnose 3,5-epimerase [Seonamhaeicola aphaedonensis]|uniref:dTDP-4-dehydrorhamnose 3,5-epimerase n=1 Tax=Seonamhaeicola aphaedonensis TaxID=1461338 RepID=A0A3D9HHJ4_9FLAO|nr:dTDP-4-dehydrorhamnose 3,5-epimerase [Seonamhaeicola aphaedonensis]RED48950.1 dTDP-4-dehydrorhamnose 3,5-epimerase [Seonamhaeicola aphaedonensis]
MTVEETTLKGCFVIKPNIFRDDRGLFFESFNDKVFKEETGIESVFVQDNISLSAKGVLRGLHFQTGRFAQAKLVSVIKGKALDVCVDIRKKSETFGQHFSIILDDIEKTQLYIPKGFAHGFLALDENTIFSYKCDNYYNKSTESGILFNDKTLNIDWRFPEEKLIVSEKDQVLPTFEAIVNAK